jgi:hypothetical protein
MEIGDQIQSINLWARGRSNEGTVVDLWHMMGAAWVTFVDNEGEEWITLVSSMEIVRPGV